MDIRVEITGLDSLDRSAKAHASAMRVELRKALLAAVLHIAAEAKKRILSGGKTGRVYKRRGVTHRASAAGESPANDTGGLVNSINASVNREGAELVGKVEAHKKSAAHLELGTSKMAARPFLFPAFESSKSWVQERLARAVRDAIRKGSK